MKSVAAAELAALAAWRTLAGGDRVGGIVFNDTELLTIAPHRSQTRGWLREFLARLPGLNQSLSIEPRK
jgi:uncharacterized protein (DUF58 family)